uniref:Uncharacterized protein n=1 Tax=Anguilla anguilla TaxID=7936 RepID=A0A0E9VT83_ANGAN
MLYVLLLLWRLVCYIHYRCLVAVSLCLSTVILFHPH